MHGWNFYICTLTKVVKVAKQLQVHLKKILCCCDQKFVVLSELPGVRLRHSSCGVHIEDCEGWWLSSCCGSVAECWWLKPCRGVLGSTPSDCQLNHFPLCSPYNIYISFCHLNYSRTSEQMTLWGCGLCPLFGGCPLFRSCLIFALYPPLV